jgi:hypothetical protein
MSAEPHVAVLEPPVLIEPEAAPPPTLPEKLKQLARDAGAMALRETVLLPERIKTNAHNIGMAAALGALAGAETWAQSKGWIDHAPGVARDVLHSVRHISLGFLGAWFARLLARNQSPKVQAAAMVAGATIMNFGVGEIGQALILNDEGPRAFWKPENLDETAKDYLFSLGGLTAYVGLGHLVKPAGRSVGSESH